MTKFDHSINLPTILSENKLAILPDSRGTYVIGYFDTYQTVPENFPTNPIEMSFPPDVESIDYTDLYSEASALLCAYNCGIIEDVIGEPVNLTVFGRMSTSRFDYRIRNRHLNDWYRSKLKTRSVKLMVDSREVQSLH